MIPEAPHKCRPSLVLPCIRSGLSQGSSRSSSRDHASDRLHRLTQGFVVLANSLSDSRAFAAVGIVILQTMILGCGSHQIESGATKSNSVAAPVQESKGMGENDSIYSVEQWSKQLNTELSKAKPKTVAATGSVLESIKSTLLQTKTAQQLKGLGNTRLLSSMLKYGEDPHIQFLAYCLIVEHSPNVKKLAAMIAVSELTIGANGVSSVLLVELGEPWGKEEIELVATAINAGMSPPKSLSTASMLSNCMPIDTQISLLTSNEVGIARSADWDAVFLSGVNTALATKEWENLSSERSRCDVVAREMLQLSGRAQYEAMWFLSNEVSVDFCVDYVFKNSSSLEEIELFCFIDRFSVQLEAAQKSGKQLPVEIERRLAKKHADSSKKEGR